MEANTDDATQRFFMQALTRQFKRKLSRIERNTGCHTIGNRGASRDHGFSFATPLETLRLMKKGQMKKRGTIEAYGLRPAALRSRDLVHQDQRYYPWKAQLKFTWSCYQAQLARKSYATVAQVEWHETKAGFASFANTTYPKSSVQPTLRAT